MTDPTAGASTDPVPETESETDAPAPDTTTEARTVGDVLADAGLDPTTPSDPSAPPIGTQAGPPVDAPVGVQGVPGRIVPGIDSSKEQGNRVTAVSEITRTDPLADIKARITGHADNAMHIVGDLRALADELEQALNKVRVGL